MRAAASSPRCARSTGSGWCCWGSGCTAAGRARRWIWAAAPAGAAAWAAWLPFGLAWLWLGKAILDAGPGLQTGAIGGWALSRGRPVRYGGMPERGLFRACRQRIYLGFALVLWTAPVRTPDLLAVALCWTGYCVVGPRHKEARCARLFGERFAAYRELVPYFVPRLPR